MVKKCEVLNLPYIELRLVLKHMTSQPIEGAVENL